MGVPKYGRQGRIVNLQFDHDALAMLKELAPTRKSYGRYLSELVRRDYIRKTEWQQRQDVLDRVRHAAS
jgi:hypothetical protein